ncbi:hypothetical protein KM043_004835 [Ampulex compressa]|nr:hypothetical protein KM043_004835 [Ampulex compressa]
MEESRIECRPTPRGQARCARRVFNKFESNGREKVGAFRKVGRCKIPSVCGQEDVNRSRAGVNHGKAGEHSTRAARGSQLYAPVARDATVGQERARGIRGSAADGVSSSVAALGRVAAEARVR